MCQLFGVSSSNRIEVNRYLQELSAHSVDHPHGWGIAVLNEGWVNLEKEPFPAWQSSYLQSRLKSPIAVTGMIAHIRNASVGGMTYENCHPFLRRDSSGNVWTLAHNGTVFHSPLLDGYVTDQTGTTDSERILCHLIRRINARQEELRRTLSDRERFLTAEQSIREIAEQNQVTLLFYDGDCMYVHTNQRNKLYYKKTGDAVLFATVPLDGDLWAPVPLMQLLAFRSGRLLFKGMPHPYEYRKEDAACQHMDSSCL